MWEALSQAARPPCHNRLQCSVGFLGSRSDRWGGSMQLNMLCDFITDQPDPGCCQASSLFSPCYIICKLEVSCFSWYQRLPECSMTQDFEASNQARSESLTHTWCKGRLHFCVNIKITRQRLSTIKLLPWVNPSPSFLQVNRWPLVFLFPLNSRWLWSPAKGSTHFNNAECCLSIRFSTGEWQQSLSDQHFHKH